MITNTIEIPAGVERNIGSSTNQTLTLAAGVREMFHIGGARVAFDDLTLDGANEGRLIRMDNSSTVVMTNTVVKNGTTQKYEPIPHAGSDVQRYPGGAIHTVNSTLILKNATFESNTTKNNVPRGYTHSLSPDGGAIYGQKTDLQISGGSFLNNVGGAQVNPGVAGSHGEGGAIKLELGSKLSINQDDTATRTLFRGNHLQLASDAGGHQGGAIEATNTDVKINRTDFFVAGPFNTGGAIKFEGSTGLVENSTFTINGLGDGGGISGGAITSEGSDVTVKSSTFTADIGSKVTFAGGFIDIVGTGSFHLLDSELTGAGNTARLATFGGAICFETGSSAVSTIVNTKIGSIAADQTGGAIAIGTKNTGNVADETSVKLTIQNSTIDGASTLYWNNADHVGGQIFVGKGAEVKILNTKMAYGISNRGGLIYNAGTTTIDEASALSNGWAFTLGGGIYNDGVLRIANATMSKNHTADYNGDQHPNKAEFSGVNVYANKDVTITPAAVLDQGDVRVLDQKSKILLTGAMANPVYVSISETPQTSGAHAEAPQRYVGYLVAEGSEGYTATQSDAQVLHYTSKPTVGEENDWAQIDDHISLGLWDLVFDPVANTVVLGQRAAMSFHANAVDAKYADGTAVKVQPYDIYSSVAPWTSPEQLQQLAEEPTRPEHTLIGWYDRAVTDADVLADATADLFDFTQKFTSSTAPIADIVSPNELHAYAGWVTSFDVTYRFVSATEGKELPQEVVDLTPAAMLNMPQGTAITPTLATTTVKVLDGTWTFVAWNPEKIESLNADVEFVGTWTFAPDLYTVTHRFVSTTEGLELPDTIVALTPAPIVDILTGETVTPSEFTPTTYEQENGTWTFHGWDKQSIETIRADGEFVGSWSFVVKKHTVIYDFLPAVEGMILPEEVFLLLPPAVEAEHGASVLSPELANTVVNTTTGSWVFNDWDRDRVDPLTGDTTVFGVWGFVSNKYKISYRFVSGTEGKELPQEILDLLPASSEGTHGLEIIPQTIDKTIEVADGTWKFVSWLPTMVASLEFDVEFVGTWIFEAKPAESSEPPVESSEEPPVESSEPPVESSEPPVESSEPPVESSEEPPVQSSEEPPEESSEESTSDSTIVVTPVDPEESSDDPVDSSEKPVKPTPTQKPGTAPKTGDQTLLVLGSILVIALAAFVGITIWKRKEMK